MRSFAGAVPFAVVATLAAVVAAVGLGPVVARRLGTRRSVATLLLFGFGLVIAVTLSPDADAFAGIASDGTCDVSRVGLASVQELTRVSASSLNVLLFVPLGVAVGLLPRTRPAAIIAVGAISLTFVVESTQLLLPLLGRGCQAADIFDNLLGLAIGFAIGILVRPMLGRSRA